MDFFDELDSLISSQYADASDASAASVLANIGSPSISIAVLDHGEISSTVISTLKGNTETLFQACSISKPITGMATMRLIQAGKLSLDSNIVDILPSHVVKILKSPHTKSLLDQITVKHLMSHTSGLSIGGFPGYTKEPPDVEAILSGNAPANTLQVRVQSFPGYTFSYSGGGMVVLQVILETVTGKNFPTLIKDLVLEPLGMTRSFFTLPEREINVARAYFTGDTPCDVEWHHMPEKAAAGLWTTPTDLLKAVRAIQRSLKSESGELLEQAIARQMLDEIQDGMALTWLAPKDPGTIFAHSGSNMPGWECFVMGFADFVKERDSKQNQGQKVWDECGVSLMTNSASGMKVWAKVFHAITYLKRWSPQAFLDGKVPHGKIPFCVYGVKVAKDWAEWRGSWFDKDKEFILGVDERGEPILRFGNGVQKLVTAAIPSLEYGEKGISIDLVVEGLEMMLRLGWKDDKRDIELWVDGTPSRLVHLTSHAKIER